jgi:hypothetical protein
MRPEGRLRAGYYATPPQALELLLRRLEVPQEPVHIFDPCAGEGLAVQQLALGLGVPHERVWCVELDATRGERCRQHLPGATVLSPCSFLQTAIRSRAFSLAYSNPPFDDSAVAGRRVEELFLSHLGPLLADDGVLVFVCPEIVTQRPKFRELLLRDFGEITILPWPAKVRRYGEVFVLARRAEFRLGDDSRQWHDETRRGLSVYPLPPAKGPGQRFKKTGFTDDELLTLLERSPLSAHLRTSPDYRLPSPPLALGVGHLALLLAAGHLDGLVVDESGVPHVVRGSARKVIQVTDEQVEDTKTSRVTTRTETERITLRVRAVWPDGIIHTLGEEESHEPATT